MTVQELILALQALPASAPVGVVNPRGATGGYDLREVNYDGEYVVLKGGPDA